MTVDESIQHLSRFDESPESVRLALLLSGGGSDRGTGPGQPYDTKKGSNNEDEDGGDGRDAGAGGGNRHRRIVQRPTVVNAFVRELRDELDFQRGLLHLESDDSQASKCDGLRLLGGYADKR